MVSLLTILSVCLAGAAAWEGMGLISAQRTGQESKRSPILEMPLSRLQASVPRLRIPERLRTAGLEYRYSPTWVLALKAAGVLAGLTLAALVVPALPGRIGPAAAVGFAAAGFFAPDAWLERRSRERRDAVAKHLPDLLDLLAVASASGRAPAGVLAASAHQVGGLLGRELEMVAAELECGEAHREAMGRLSERIPGGGLEALTAAMVRSARYGSPLADQLAEQAVSLRAVRRRQIDERAQRAAPKIQLVIALVLVPSVLLIVAAVLFSNSDVLLGGI